MSEAVARLVLLCAGGYLLAGLLFAMAFLAMGIGRVDPAARHTPLGFKLVVLPGVMVLWPLLAWRWASGVSQPPDECSPHMRAASRQP